MPLGVVLKFVLKFWERVTYGTLNDQLDIGGGRQLLAVILCRSICLSVCLVCHKSVFY